MQNPINRKLNFIPDIEINLDEYDLLGSSPYVDTILQIIKDTNTKFTIGLFGGWGSGKSSIINTLDIKLQKDKSTKAKVFVYDAWKYSKDSFRRTFIFELKKKFNLDTTEEFDSFYMDKHEDISGKTGLIKGWYFYLILFLVPIIFVNFEPFFIDKTFEFTTFIISLFFSALTIFVTNTFVQYKISITKPKVFAPEQFEEIFKEIIDRITKKKKGPIHWIRGLVKDKGTIDKVVIVIDNIDRCHKDLAFELLLTIKNFIDCKNVIFIIPIDEPELRKHLSQNGHDANEFLRKLFNTTLTIKKFSETDLSDFAEELNKKYKLNFSNEVLSLVSQEFSKNPRKIIQFLNMLQTELILANEQEEKGNIPKGTITDIKDHPFFTKILLIREEWPELYTLLKENPYLLIDINKELEEDMSKNYNLKTKLYELKASDVTIELTLDQYRFLSRTSHIESNNIELFFVNKDNFNGIPDELNTLILSRDWGHIKNHLNDDRISFDKLLKFIDKRFNQEIKRGLIKTSGVNIFSLIFKIANDEEFSERFQNRYYSDSKDFGEIRAKLNSVYINDLVISFNPKELLFFIKINITKNKKLISEIIKVIESRGANDNYGDKSDKLLNAFIETFKNHPDILKRIGNAFSEMLVRYPTKYHTFKEYLTDEVIVECLINSRCLEYLISKLDSKPNENDVQLKIEIIKNYDTIKGLNSKLTEKLIKHIVFFLDSDNLNIQKFWLNTLNDFIKNVKEESLGNIIDVLDKRFKHLLELYNSRWDYEEYQLALKPFLDVSTKLYMTRKDESDKLKIINWLNSFFNKNDIFNIYLHINQLYQNIVNHYPVFDWSFAPQVISRFDTISDWEQKQKLAETLNLMLSKTNNENGLNETQRITILTKYISLLNENDKQDLVKTWFNLIMSNPIVKNNLTQIITDLSSKEKLNLLEIINDLDKELLQDTVDKIFLDTGYAILQERYDLYISGKVNVGVIKHSIKKVLKELSQEEDKTKIKYILDFIIKNKLVDKTISNLVIPKIKPLLVSSNKDENIFALNVVHELSIEDNQKKNAINTLIADIDDTDFDDSEKKLLTHI